MVQPRILPTGTVTFLFSDIEGSTRLVQEVGPAVYTEILERHNVILRAAFGRHGGVERGTQGDSFLVMFHEAPAALAAVAKAQLALAAEQWPHGTAVKVRMGLHSGVGRAGGDDYVGLDVNRAARIAAAAHGGQVLVSDATRALTTDALPAGVTIRRLGEHHLKDIAQVELVHQLVIDGLPADFPPIRTARATGNLPPRLTSFIGREAELAQLGELLEQNRLITLTGVGGAGKTSLAVEFARSREAGFERGAWFVSLETTTEPSLVARSIATGLRLIEAPGVDATQTLADFFEDRPTLLVVDNFEHLLPAAPLIGELLRAASGLSVLVTSRSPLRLGAEQEYPVGPLSVPAVAETTADRTYSDAVRLFIERAGRVRPGYAPTAEEIPAIEEICRRLDGLPLGIELAASRVGILPPRAIAERLVSRLDLPGAGPSDAPDRQRSLHGAIAWSHDLLDEAERRLLARLSIFVGGWRLAEAEAVCGPEADLGIEVLEGLSRLIEHSLVHAVPGPDGARFRLLETIRAFAALRLAENGEGLQIARRHAFAYRDLAELAAPNLPGRNQLEWLDRLSTEHDNLQMAIRWALDHGEAEMAMRLGAALWRFWQMRGHIEEGSRAIREILSGPGAMVSSRWRMRALEAAGGLHWWSAQTAAADASYRAQLETARDLNDDQGVADAVFNLMHTAFASGDPTESERLRDEAIRLYRVVCDERSIARVDFTSAFALVAAGLGAEATEVVVAALERFEELGDDFYAGIAASALAGITLMSGDPAGALRLEARATNLVHAMGDIAGTTLGLRSGAVFLLTMGRAPEAAVLYGRFDALCRRHGIRRPADETDLTSLGWSDDRLAAAMDGYVDEKRRGAEMTTDEALELMTRLAGELATPPTPITGA